MLADLVNTAATVRSTPLPLADQNAKPSHEFTLPKAITRT